MESPTPASLVAASRLPRLEAEVLVAHALGQPRSWLAAHSRDVLGTDAIVACEALLARRRAGEPVAYIVGEREFHGLAFRVDRDVLIPRAETELLVDLALEALGRQPRVPRPRVLDLATGSGAVAVALAHAAPWIEMVASDVSPAALAVAAGNASRQGVAVRFAAGDWFAPFVGERFAVIVANPPYVAIGDPHLATGDLRFEPPLALASGEDGLDAIRTIVTTAPAHLDPDGLLLLEHGYDQGERCRRLLASAGYVAVATWRDLAGIERVSGGRRPA